MTYLLLVLLLMPVQSEPDALFAEGNARFDAGNYVGARAAYAQVIADGRASVGLYFNLADTYFRLDSLGQAIRYLEKARALSPDDPRVAHNLRIVRARLNLSDTPVPAPYWETGAAWLHRNVSPLVLFCPGLALFLAALTLVAWRVWTDSASPWIRRGLLVLIPSALLPIALAFALSADAGIVRRAVNLRPVEMETPDAETVKRLPEGRVVRVIARAPHRVGIETPDGARGWLAADAVGEI